MKIENRRNLIKIIIVAFFLILVYWPTFVWMKIRFLGADSYYTHGFLVPIVSGWLIYRRKDKLKNIPLAPCTSGLFVLLLGLGIHLLGLLFQIRFVSGFSLIIILVGLSLYLIGKKFTKEILFPLIFLIFMIPIPRVLIVHISFRMKLIAAEAGARLISWLNIPSQRAGSIVYLPNTSLTIGSPCSGLRSLIALCGLGAVFAYIQNISKTKKTILFLSAIPLALVANILRIGVLLWVAYIYGSDFATGKFHDYSGILTFIFALIGLIFVNRLLKWKSSE